MFALKVLGTVSLQGQDIPVPSAAQQKRRLGLLVLLALGGARGLSRERVQAFLWPESSEARARHALDQLVYATRRALSPDSILSDGGELRLNPDIIAPDLWEFDEAIRQKRWEAAAEVYGGPLVDGFHFSDCRELESWVDAERARREHEYRAALETLARAAGAEGNHALEITWWRRLAASDPLSSRTAHGLIEALQSAGDRTGALNHARAYQKLVRAELGVEADVELRKLIAGLEQPAATVPQQPAERHPIRSPAVLASANSALMEERPRYTASLNAERTPVAANPEAGGVRKPLYSRRGAAFAGFSMVVLLGSGFLLERATGGDFRPGGTTSAGARREPTREAKQSYLRGVNVWNDRSHEALDTAVVYFRNAIELDPSFAEAYAGLANAYVMLGYSGYRPAAAMFPKAKAAALRSIRLDSSLAAPYAALGMELTWERDFARAEAAYRKAISLDSAYATAHQWYGILKMIRGRKDEAVAELRKAAELDPLSLQIQNNYATFLAAAGQSDAAFRHYEKVVGQEPDSAWVRRNPWLLTNMSGLLVAKGHTKRGIEAAELAVQILPRHPRALFALSAIYYRTGHPALAERVFARADRANEHYPAYRAMLYGEAGQEDSVIAWLNRVEEWGVPILISLQTSGSLKEVRNDPRFVRIMGRLGLRATR